jgi:hypothetical protein
MSKRKSPSTLPDVAGQMSPSGIRRAESRHQQTHRKARDHGTEVVGKDSGTNEQSGFNQKPQNWEEKMMPLAFLHQPHRRPKACLPENMHDRVGMAEKLMFLSQSVLLAPINDVRTTKRIPSLVETREKSGDDHGRNAAAD